MSDEHHYSDLISTWTCSRCTLVNETRRKSCIACENPRSPLETSPQPDAGVVEFQPKPGSTILSRITGGRELRWGCPRCTWQNEEDASLCQACGFRALNVMEKETLATTSSKPSSRESESIPRAVGRFLKQTFVPSADANHSIQDPEEVLEGWKCPYCSFVNHCDLLYCEQCREVPGGEEPTTSDYLQPVSFTKKTDKKLPPPRPSYLPKRPSEKKKPKPERPKQPPSSQISSSNKNKPPRPANPPSVSPKLTSRIPPASLSSLKSSPEPVRPPTKPKRPDISPSLSHRPKPVLSNKSIEIPLPVPRREQETTKKQQQNPVAITSVLFSNSKGRLVPDHSTDLDRLPDSPVFVNNSDSETELGNVTQSVSCATNEHDSSSHDKGYQLLFKCQRSQSLTAEEVMEIDKSRAMAIWYDIVDRYKNKRESFIDPDFPHSNKSLYLTPNKPISHWQVSKWACPSQIRSSDYGRWRVVRDPKISDIAQGVLGNCWFLSALAVVAEFPELIQNIILTKEICSEGVYQVCLCRDGMWTVILVDDFFPVNFNGELTFSKARRKQLWVPLIEKALAKMYGCYEALDGGQVIEGLQALTGYPCEKFRLRGNSESDMEDTDFEYLWTRLLSFKEARYPMAGCTLSDYSMLAHFEAAGLKPYHAYSVLDLKQEGSERKVLLRDPWGRGGKTTNWFGGATSERGDGTFWMGVWDFYRFFGEIDICHYNPDWHCLRTKVVLPHYGHAHQPVLHFHVFEPTEIVMSFSQPSQRYSTNTRVNSDLALVVVKLPPCATDTPDKSSLLPLPTECVAVSQSHILPCVSCDALLGPGRYAVLPLSFKKWYQHSETSSDSQDAAYVIALFSSKVLEWDENLPTRPGFLRESLYLSGKKFGKSKEAGLGVRICSIQFRPSLFVIICENHDTNYHIEMVCNCQGSTNVCSSRKELICQDIIPPRHKEVLMVLTQVEYTDPCSYSFSFVYKQCSTNTNGGWGAVHAPPLDKVNSELHQPDPLKETEPVCNERESLLKMVAEQEPNCRVS